MLKVVRNYFDRFKAWANKHEGLLLLLGLVILFRIPSLFEPHHYGDEEIYFVLGRGWRAGVGLYSGVFDHKPPFIYLLAGLAGTVFWFRMILLGWMLVHTWLFSLLSDWFWKLPKNKWLTKKRRGLMQFLSVLIFVTFTTLPGLEGNIPNGELFMMMPVTAAFVLLLRTKKPRIPHYFYAGLLMGLALLFKVPIIFDFAALVIYYFFFIKKTLRQGLKEIIKPAIWVMVLGLVLPYLISLGYYYAMGTGPDYLRASLLVNFGYTSSYATSSQEFNPLASGLFIRGMILSGFTLILYILRKRLNKGLLFASLWLAWSLFAALLSARPYPHYLQQPIVAFALLAPMILVLERVVDWLVVAFFVIGGVITQQTVKFWYYPTVTYYKNFAGVVTGKLSGQEYIETFSNSKLNFAVADYLNERMASGDALYVWGTDTSLYNLTETLPTGGRYIVSFHVRDWGAYGEVMENLEANRPDFIVILPDPIEFPDLFDWIEENYRQTTNIEGALVYHRI